MYGKVALAGAAGTAARVVGVLPLTVAMYGNPLTLLVLNTFGCFVAGVVQARLGESTLKQIVNHGLLGAFTTFSSVIIAAGRIGHGLGLVDADTFRMTTAGLALAFGYVFVSVAAGFVALASARRLARR